MLAAARPRGLLLREQGRHHVGGFACDGNAKTVVRDNAYYTSSGAINECGADLAAWQAKGNDKGSTVAKFPTDATVIGWAKTLLSF